MGGGPRRDGALRRRHLLHLHPPHRVLPLRRPCVRPAEPHLHRRRARHAGRVQGEALLRHPALEPFRHRHRRLDRRVRQHAVCCKPKSHYSITTAPRLRGDNESFCNTTRTSRAIRRAGCFHYRGHDDPCHASTSPYIAIFGVMQVVFSQIPDLDKVWWLSIVAAIMSLSYSTIGVSLGAAEIVANRGLRGSLAGIISTGARVTVMQKVWRNLQAFGNIAFAYGFSIILLEIQDTIKSPPPSEAVVMKKATAVSVAVTTVIYLLCGCVGYAAFGSAAPDNMLTGFGFYEPFWLLDVANAFVVVHLVGTYQVMTQPVFAYVERRASAAWPGSALVRETDVRVGRIMAFSVSPIRMAWRTAYVCVTTAVAMLLPFFGSVVGFIGAVSFWPLTVYFPVEMYIAHRRVARGSTQWLLLHALSAGCLVVSIAAAAGSIAGVVEELKAHNPFCWSC
ncbi:hypothetical protein PAHAL_6G076800 [Panicum hallii]|uniref:Amino acid transporter transmembrane domain-containing protein n=1 Tax=Panicum hallii TaxID=206008 RepID=A0A2T8IFQ2_9POAL|nr:hypothetical protein PAHAL_6G076800 [Panicum hallii]